MKNIDATNRSILVIPDMHIPFHHLDSCKFIKAVMEEVGDSKTLIMNLGDELDAMNLSFHTPEVDLGYNAKSELDKSVEILHSKGGLYEMFPKMYLCDSNHSSLIYRRSRANGIPRDYLKPLCDVYKVGKKWEWHDDYMVKTKRGSIYFTHGRSSVPGKVGASVGGASSVQGHFHSKFQLVYFGGSDVSRGSDFVRFCAYSGCLISLDSLAFFYGRIQTSTPILGLLWISMEGNPVLYKMHLKNNRWTGRL